MQRFPALGLTSLSSNNGQHFVNARSNDLLLTTKHFNQKIHISPYTFGRDSVLSVSHSNVAITAIRGLIIQSSCNQTFDALKLQNKCSYRDARTRLAIENDTGELSLSLTSSTFTSNSSLSNAANLAVLHNKVGDLLLTAQSGAPSIFVSSNTGFVGFNTTQPESCIHVHAETALFEHAQQSGVGPNIVLRNSAPDRVAGNAASIVFQLTRDSKPHASITAALDKSSSDVTNIVFASKGTERFRIAHDGKLGIGVNNPVAEIHVASIDSPSCATLYLGSNDEMGYGLTKDSDGRLGFYRGIHGETTRELVCMMGNDGKVGVRTSLPWAPLHVASCDSNSPHYNGVLVTQDDSSNNAIIAAQTKKYGSPYVSLSVVPEDTPPLNPIGWSIGVDPTNDHMLQIRNKWDWGDGNVNFSMDHSGRDVIFKSAENKTSPTLTLASLPHVNNRSVASLSFYGGGYTDADIGSIGAEICYASHHNGYLTIGNKNDLIGTKSEIARFTSSGRLGLGTSHPRALMDVRGDIVLSEKGTSELTTDEDTSVFSIGVNYQNEAMNTSNAGAAMRIDVRHTESDNGEGIFQWVLRKPGDPLEGRPLMSLDAGGRLWTAQSLTGETSLTIGSNATIAGSLTLKHGNVLDNLTKNQIMFGYDSTELCRHAIKSRHNANANNANNAIDFYLWQTYDGTRNVGTKRLMSIQSTGVDIQNHLNVTGALTCTTIDTRNNNIHTGTGVITTNNMLASGLVGIGTSAPRGPLHIYESTGTTPNSNNGSLIIEHGNTNGVSSIVFPCVKDRGSYYAYISFTENVIPGYNFWNGANAMMIGGGPDSVVMNPAGYLALVPGAEITYIRGRLGVGVHTPSESLHIEGNTYVNGTIKIPANGNGISWGSNISRIVDDGTTMHIVTDNHLTIQAPLSLSITSASTTLSGTLSCKALTTNNNTITSGSISCTSITCGSITSTAISCTSLNTNNGTISSGAINTNNYSVTCGNITCGTIQSTSINTNNNSVTCGSIQCKNIHTNNNDITSGAISCTTINTNSNSITCGPIQCTSINTNSNDITSASISCTSINTNNNSITCGPIHCESINTNNNNITSASISCTSINTNNNAIVCGSIESASISCTTINTNNRSVTCGPIQCKSINTNNNDITSAAISCTSINTNNNSVTCGSITSAAINCTSINTNNYSITCGPIQCSSINTNNNNITSAAISCTSINTNNNSVTCGPLTCTTINTNNNNVTAGVIKCTTMNCYTNDINYGVSVIHNNLNGATKTNYQGGLQSYHGIGFKCAKDNITRHIFDTQNGNFTADGVVNAGSVSTGPVTCTSLNTSSGPITCGPITCTSLSASYSVSCDTVICNSLHTSYGPVSCGHIACHSINTFNNDINAGTGSVSAENVVIGNSSSKAGSLRVYGTVYASSFQTDSGVGFGIVPIGAIVMWTTTSTPDGWVFCKGQSLYVSSYPELFAVIGNTYGGNSTVFYLPDLSSRVVVGAGQGAGLASRTLGSTGGTETHTLTQAEMPSHTHTNSVTSAGSHSHSGSTTTEAGEHSHEGWTSENGDHKHNWTHGQAKYDSDSGNITGGGELDPWPFDIWTNNAGQHAHNVFTHASGKHTHSISINSDGSHSHTCTINSTGNGQSHNNMQPFIALNFIIRAK